MKNRTLYLSLSGFFLCAAAMPVRAQEKSKEELKLETSAAELDKKYTEGQVRVAQMIKSEFGVDGARMVGLRSMNIGYGEIAIALGLAQQMRGAVTDENLRRIMALRRGPPAAGWGRVAAELGLKLGPVLGKVRKIAARVRKQEKVAGEKKDKRTGDDKNGKPEKLATSGKPDRPEGAGPAQR
ncbi:MAG: hypothetical protein A3J79_04240 [Elusimicrobia bacterium RIFOXYB2_FULL_62_6]|nr:MAG: hypothetical protein A3J79_04240 [Elusimicrobia bacterium RIFOXYB2_FULL_62_6]